MTKDILSLNRVFYQQKKSLRRQTSFAFVDSFSPYLKAGNNQVRIGNHMGTISSLII